MSIQQCPCCETTPLLPFKVHYFASTILIHIKPTHTSKSHFYFHFNNIFTLSIPRFEYMSGEYKVNRFETVFRRCYVRTSRL